MKYIFLLIMILSVSLAAAEDLITRKFESVEYDPEIVRTGDNVFCRIKLAEGALPETLYAEENINYEFTDIKINISSGEVLLWFIPFNPGEKYLPVLKGEGFILEKVPIEIKKYSSSEDTVSEAPGAVLLPGTRLFFGFLFFVVTLFIFLIYYFLKFFYKPFKSGLTAVIRESEIRKTVAAIKSLQTEINKKDSVVFCRELSFHFKQYLGKRYSPIYKSYTSGEIAENFLLMGILNENKTESLKNMLYSSDRIRFGKKDDFSTDYVEDIYRTVEAAVDISESEFQKKEGE